MKYLLSYFIVGLTLLGCTTNELETNVQQLNISTEMGELDNVIYPLSSNYQQMVFKQRLVEILVQIGKAI